MNTDKEITTASRPGIMYVKTLGAFGLTYDGMEIALGARDESQI